MFCYLSNCVIYVLQERLTYYSRYLLWPFSTVMLTLWLEQWMKSTENAVLGSKPLRPIFRSFSTFDYISDITRKENLWSVSWNETSMCMLEVVGSGHYFFTRGSAAKCVFKRLRLWTVVWCVAWTPQNAIMFVLLCCKINCESWRFLKLFQI